MDPLNREFNVHTLDFPGHGERPLFSHFNIKEFAFDVFEFMDQKGLSSAHFFGYSMGGYVALYGATQDSDRFESIITLGTKFNWSPGYALEQKKLLNPDKIKEKVPRYAQYLSEIHGDSKWRLVLNHTADMMAELGNSNLLTKDVLSQIPHRVTIGRGENDKMVDVEESVVAANALPNGKYQELKDAPHPLEKVDHRLLTGYIVDNLE